MFPSGILDEREPLTPRHVGRLAQRPPAGVADHRERGVDVLDVDEQLVPRAGARLDAGEHPGRRLCRHAEFRRVALQGDEAGSTGVVRHPEALLEAEGDVEGGDRLDVVRVQDGKRTQGHGGTVAAD